MLASTTVYLKESKVVNPSKKAIVDDLPIILLLVLKKYEIISIVQKLSLISCLGNKYHLIQHEFHLIAREEQMGGASNSLLLVYILM